MVNGLGSVRAVLGSEAGGGLSDKDIKDSLWYYYFDVEKTVEYLLGAPCAHSSLARMGQARSSRADMCRDTRAHTRTHTTHRPATQEERRKGER